MKIADFGLAKKLDGDGTEFFKCGTPSYIAPEILRGNGYSQRADIFSIGSMMYNLVSGKYLFDEKDHHSHLKLNRECNLDHIA